MSRPVGVVEGELDRARAQASAGVAGSLEQCAALEAELAPPATGGLIADAVLVGERATTVTTSKTRTTTVKAEPKKKATRGRRRTT